MAGRMKMNLLNTNKQTFNQEKLIAENWIKRHWLYLALIIVVIWFLRRSIFITIENYQLAKSGQLTKAIVTDRKWESSSYRNSDGFFYVFKLGSFNYEGNTFDEDIKPNDSIDIIYLPNNPSVNRPLDFIKRNYNLHKNDKSLN